MARGDPTDEAESFTEAQIVSILREYDAGTPIVELARKHGIHANTLRLWKSKYGGSDRVDSTPFHAQ